MCILHLIAVQIAESKDMQLKTTTCVKIVKGLGLIDFPDALKSEPLASFLRCSSLHLESNSSADNEALFIVSSGSYHVTKNHERKKNILCMFKNTSTGGLINYNCETKIPITIPQDVINVEIVNSDGLRKNVSALGVFEIQGTVKNKFLSI